MKERILEFLTYLGIGQTKFEEKVGLSRGLINNIKGNISIKSLNKISYAYPELNIAWLQTGEGEMLKETTTQLAPLEVREEFALRTDRVRESQMVPLYELEATAGIRSMFIGNHQRPTEHIYIPNLSPCDGAVFARGNSMSPLIQSGDIILFKQVKNIDLMTICWGEIYMISYGEEEDNYIVIKYLRKSSNEGFATLASFNPEHKSQDIPLSSIRALALVKAAVKYTTMF